MSRSYELFLHYKQGDDFAQALEAHPDDIPAALRTWEQHFRNNASVCARLAKAFEGKNLIVNAGTHHIDFTPGDDAARECLEVMAQEELLRIEDWGDAATDEIDNGGEG